MAEMAEPAGAGIDRSSRTGPELIAYFVLAYAITFGLGAAFIFFRPQFEAVVGHIASPLHSWLYYAAVSAPTVSAVVVSLAWRGVGGVRTLFGGLIRPFRLRWALAAFLTIPAALMVWGLIERILPGSAPHAIDLHALSFAPLLWFTTPVLLVDPGPWGEETGWRGFALPRLLARLSPLAAAILLGAIWSIWHTPAFFVSGLTQFGTDFAWFMTGGICLTIFMTWIYVNANRNYLIAGVVPHAMSNLLFTAHVYNAIQVEGLAYMAIAVLIVAFFGPSLKGWNQKSENRSRKSEAAAV